MQLYQLTWLSHRFRHVELKRRTAEGVACCSSISSYMRIANTRIIGIAMLNKTRPNVLKITGSLSLTPLCAHVLPKKSSNGQKPWKPGFLDDRISEVRVNTSNPMIAMIWLLPVVWFLWSCKQIHSFLIIYINIHLQYHDGTHTKVIKPSTAKHTHTHTHRLKLLPILNEL